MRVQFYKPMHDLPTGANIIGNHDLPPAWRAGFWMNASKRITKLQHRDGGTGHGEL